MCFVSAWFRAAEIFLEVCPYRAGHPGSAPRRAKVLEFSAADVRNENAEGKCLGSKLQHEPLGWFLVAFEVVDLVIPRSAAHSETQGPSTTAPLELKALKVVTPNDYGNGGDAKRRKRKQIRVIGSSRTGHSIVSACSCNRIKSTHKHDRAGKVPLLVLFRACLAPWSRAG